MKTQRSYALMGRGSVEIDVTIATAFIIMVLLVSLSTVLIAAQLLREKTATVNLIQNAIFSNAKGKTCVPRISVENKELQASCSHGDTNS